MTQPIIVTPLLGAGSTPCGSSPCGSGSPATTTQPTPFVLLPDEITGNSRTGRFIDKGTGQYAIDGQGGSFGMGTVPQIVQIAVCDIDFSSIDVVTPSAPSVMLNLIVSAPAIATLIAQNQLQVLPTSGAVQFGVNGILASFVWRDLTTGREFTPTIGSST